MIINLSCSTNNLKNSISDFTFLPFTFTSNADLLQSSVLKDGLIQVIGRLAADAYKESPYFNLSCDFKTQTEQISDEDIRTLKDNVTLYYTILKGFISFLWLIKDNCCSINSLHVFISDEKKLMQKVNSTVWSTCEGDQHVPILFSDREIQEAALLYLQGSQFFYHNNIRISQPGDQVFDTLAPRTIIPADITKVTRIERAFQFLELARTTSSLPLKISFYICIYESLFYGKNEGEITHQIAERVALYFADSRHMRLSIYKQLKIAYGVRSTYFHGNSFKKGKFDFPAISIFLDHLTRDILRKVIEKDSAIFLQDDNSLELSFKDLLFEDERHPVGLTIETGLKHLRFNS